MRIGDKTPGASNVQAPILVTRPEPDATRWVARLCSHRLPVSALPLIVIEPLPEATAITAARMNLAGYAAVMFVSRAAVTHFLGVAPALPWPEGVRAWATGRGTMEALLQASVPPDQVEAPEPGSPQFDSEALWQRVGAQVRPGLPYLIVRGLDALAPTNGKSADGSGAADDASAGSGRDWLTSRLLEHGARVERLAVYRRALPIWDPATRRRAEAAASDGTIWLFTSAQAVTHLRTLLPGQDWTAARALATHRRVADAARAAGFGAVATTRPDLESLIASIKSLQ